MNAGLPPAGSGCVSGLAVLPGVRLFHDAKECPPEFGGSAGEALHFRTGRMDGRYLSFVTELSRDLTAQIRVGMFLILDLDLSSEPAHPAYIRAHLTNDGGSEELNDLIVLKDGRRTVRFNLDGLRIPLDQQMQIWVHAILAEPQNVALSLTSFDVSIEEQ